MVFITPQHRPSAGHHITTAATPAPKWLSGWLVVRRGVSNFWLALWKPPSHETRDKIMNLRKKQRRSKSHACLHQLTTTQARQAPISLSAPTK
jgi:hypothetical protein